MNPDPVDGRHKRRHRSRQRIVQAMIQLVQEGVVEPTAEKVSDLAGVTIRTVFRHFADMDSLYREISLEMEEQARNLFDGQLTGSNWPEQLHHLIDRRVLIFENLMAMRIAAESLRHRSEFLSKDLQKFVSRTRSTLKNVLPEQLVNDPICFESIDVILSFETWIRLRRDQRLTIRRARDVTHWMITKVTEVRLAKASQ
jgi:AcrR family transcriptional regulator